MFDPAVAFTPEELEQIEKSGLTIEEVRDFLSRFPDQSFETGVGGALMEKQHKAEGATIPLDSSLQDIANEPKVTDAPTTAE